MGEMGEMAGNGGEWVKKMGGDGAWGDGVRNMGESGDLSTDLDGKCRNNFQGRRKMGQNRKWETSGTKYPFSTVPFSHFSRGPRPCPQFP